VITANNTGVNTQVGTAAAANSSNSDLTTTGASFTYTNNLGNTHGLTIGDTTTVLSGGATSTQLSLGSNDVTFSNVGTGNPIVVHGVANGVAANDAVNVSQLGAVQTQVTSLSNDVDHIKGGVASSAAMANIPQVDTNKRFSLGVGYGNYASKSAVAIGGS